MYSERTKDIVQNVRLSAEAVTSLQIYPGTIILANWKMVFTRNKRLIDVVEVKYCLELSGF